MNERKIGTVLPTAASLRCNAEFARRDAAARAAAARRLGLTRYERRTVGGEVRYYDGPGRYGIIMRNCWAAWFSVGANGDERRKRNSALKIIENNC